MGLLKSLGLKKKTGKGSNHGDDEKTPSSPSSQSPTPKGRRPYVAASGPLTPSNHLMQRSSFDRERESDLRSDGELDDSASDSGRTGERREEEDSVSELSDHSLQDRSLRRAEAVMANRNRSENADFSRRVLQGGSLRSLSVKVEEPSAGSAQRAATVADRPSSKQHRRNPSLETILKNMYDGDGGPNGEQKEKLQAVPETNHIIQPGAGSKSGQLAPRDFTQERDSHRISKARSGVLSPRTDWGAPEERTTVRAPRSGQLTPRDFTQEERQAGAQLSARATRLGQVAPHDMLPDHKTPPKASSGGSGTLQARDWGQESEGILQAGRSRSGQLAPRESGVSLGVKGPRSMSSHKAQRDVFQGERQQKGAAQRRLSRNRGGSGPSSGEEPPPPTTTHTPIVPSAVRRSAGRQRNDGWQETIVEVDENGSGTMQPAGSGKLLARALEPQGSSTATAPKSPPQISPTGGMEVVPPASRPRIQSESLYSSTRTPGASAAPPPAPANPQTPSERLAASLAASVASVQQAQKRGTRSGSLQPVLSMPHGRRQDGPSDNVLQRPFANVREKYQLQMEELGRGRFGVIRVCLDRKTGERLACKSISKARLKTFQDADDVRKEVTVMELLQGHPHVVNLKGAFEDALNVHLVMELCEGGELFDRIMAKKRYNEQESAIVCRTVVGVLRYCHALGYIHRDLKPENILLCSKDNDTSVKVIDFGVATPFKPGQACTEEVGTPFYLAPEVLQQSYGPEADIWSAGVVLYILLCGVPPFWAKDNDGIRAAIQEGKLDLTSGPWKTISESAKDLVRQMLTLDPLKRIKGDQILSHPWIANLGRV